MPSPASPRSSFLRAAAASLLQLGAILLLGLGSTSGLLWLLHINPLDCFQAIFSGSLTSWARIGHLLSIWVPLLLCCCGLLFSFRASLWNVGIEGQVLCGAIGCVFVLKGASLSLPPAILLSLALVFGAVAGGTWGLLAGLLRNRGGVNEIFGGLGLNFVAQALVLWLIFGPWKREGVASMSGTDLFPRTLWLPLPEGWRVTPLALALAIGAFLLTCLLLSMTRFGLHLKAVGQNERAARIFSIDPARLRLAALGLAGSLAGLAGALQVTAVYHRLIPAISSGYGYLGLLVVMLAAYRAPTVPLIALFFAVLVSGSIQLPIVLQIDSSLAGVIQGSCVLAGLIVFGLRQRMKKT